MNGQPTNRKSLITFDDSGSIDAFGRARVAAPVLLCEMKRVGNVPDTFATMSISGSGATTYTTNRSSTYLTVGTGVGKVIRQSKQRIIYQAGKSLEIMCTHVMAPAQTNLRQRVGYFDDKNGVFLQLSGSVASFSIRNYITGSAVDDNVVQSSWNIDKLDGTGISGVTANFTKNQIFFADLQWLGVGRVRVGLVIGGKLYYAHEFNHANVTEGVYMSNPNLPIRWEIEATGTVTGTPQLEAICASVNSEGGYEINGVTYSTGSGTTGKAIAAGANAELLAIRLQSAYTEYATAFVKMLSIINTTSGPFRWRIVLNPTETGAGTWDAVTGSVMERNLTRTVTVDTGTVLDSGYVSSLASSIATDSSPVLTMGTTLAGVTDVVSLQIFNLSVQSEDFFGSLTWREVY